MIHDYTAVAQGKVLVLTEVVDQRSAAGQVLGVDPELNAKIAQLVLAQNVAVHINAVSRFVKGKHLDAFADGVRNRMQTLLLCEPQHGPNHRVTVSGVALKAAAQDHAFADGSIPKRGIGIFSVTVFFVVIVLFIIHLIFCIVIVKIAAVVLFIGNIFLSVHIGDEIAHAGHQLNEAIQSCDFLGSLCHQDTRGFPGSWNRE